MIAKDLLKEVRLVQAWKCPACGDIWDSCEDANVCCLPTESSLYECSGCGFQHEDEDKAKQCCTSEGAVFRLTQKKLEEHGQLRLIK